MSAQEHDATRNNKQKERARSDAMHGPGRHCTLARSLFLSRFSIELTIIEIPFLLLPRHADGSRDHTPAFINHPPGTITFYRAAQSAETFVRVIPQKARAVTRP